MGRPFRLPENDVGGVRGHRVQYFSGVGGIRESDRVGHVQAAFGVSGSLWAVQKLGFLRKLRFQAA